MCCFLFGLHHESAIRTRCIQGAHFRSSFNILCAYEVPFSCLGYLLTFFVLCAYEGLFIVVLFRHQYILGCFLYLGSD